MITNYNELDNEINMLKGNINRICVSDDYEELERMYMYAKIRLDEIYDYNLSRIKKYDVLYKISEMDYDNNK